MIALLLAAALAAEPEPARDPARAAHVEATPPPDSGSGDPPKPPQRPPPAKDRAREARPGGEDPDAEILSHLELLERMELLEHLDLFDDGCDARKAPPGAR